MTCLRFSSRWTVAQSGSVAPVALLLAGRGEELCFQRGVGHLGWQRPAQSRRRQPLQRQPDRRRRNPDPPGDLVTGYPGRLQPKHLAHLAHRDPLCWHQPLPWQKPQERTLSGPAETPLNRATSSRIGGRNHLGTPSDIKSEWLGDIIPEFPGDFPRNPHLDGIGEFALQCIGGELQIGAVNPYLEVDDLAPDQEGHCVDKTVQPFAIDQLAEEPKAVPLLARRRGAAAPPAVREASIIDEDDIVFSETPIEVSLEQEMTRRDEAVDMSEMRANPPIPEKEFVGAQVRQAHGATAQAGAIAQALLARSHHLPVGRTDRNEFVQGVDNSSRRAGDPRQVKQFDPGVDHMIKMYDVRIQRS